VCAEYGKVSRNRPDARKRATCPRLSSTRATWIRAGATPRADASALPPRGGACELRRRRAAAAGGGRGEA